MNTHLSTTNAISCQALVLALDHVLSDLSLTIGLLRPHYQSGASEASGPIGAHVRHCLDHARALIDRAPDAPIDYDARLRGTTIEHDPGAAVAEINRLRTLATGLSGMPSDRAVEVVMMPTREGRCLTLSSTLGREIMFVLSHSVHHQALIRMSALTLGVRLPASVGFAPSTLSHQDRSACAH
jgi:hypothetical protein